MTDIPGSSGISVGKDRSCATRRPVARAFLAPGLAGAPLSCLLYTSFAFGLFGQREHLLGPSHFVLAGGVVTVAKRQFLGIQNQHPFETEFLGENQVAFEVLEIMYANMHLSLIHIS